MLNHLANYLLQYRKVSIPHVGTMQVVQHPPQLNVVDKELDPPTFSIEIGPEEDIADHQLLYLDRATGQGKETVLRNLRFLGDSIRRRIDGGGFDWNGLGTLKPHTQSLPFAAGALQPVPAQKVIRLDTPHNVLVGDRNVSSADRHEQKSEVHTRKAKRSELVIIAWVLLVLSVIFIAVWLYLGKFKTNAAGTRLSPTGVLVQPSARF